MYLVDGRRYEADERGLDHALAAAYDGRVRPLCLCSQPPIPVYVARLGETFVLKRMPFTGSQHAVACSHYESPADLSGPGEVLGTAMSEKPDTGVTQLHVSFALSKGGPRRVASGSGQDSGSVRSERTRLSLRGLLHLLWHEAELTRWQPGFAGKRSWSVVRSRLLAAATTMTVRGVPLVDVLYVPETFVVANRDEIDTRRTHRFASGLQEHGQIRPLMLLIGEVKEIVPTRFHFKAVIKHLPDQVFLLHCQLHRRMVKHFERELSLWDSSDNIRLIVMGTFALNAARLSTIEELTLMSTSSQWLPVEDRYELLLVNRLVSDGRIFEKALRSNARPESHSATTIFLQTPGGDRPVPGSAQH